MVLMNLFAGQEERLRHRKQTNGYSGQRRGCKLRQCSIEINTLPCVK